VREADALFSPLSRAPSLTATIRPHCLSQPPSDRRNNAVAQSLGKEPNPTTCALEYFHKAVPAPAPEGDNFTECHPWKENACCHEATVTTPEAINSAYGSGYLWNRCDGWVDGYKMSDACERFFVQEACMYECSPHAGQYRRYTDGEAAAFAAFSAVEGNPGNPYGAFLATDAVYQGTFDHLGVTYNKSVFFGNGVYGPNSWQMYKMPIKASYCDAFLTACANDYFCGTGDFWECSADYQADIRAKTIADEAAALTAALQNYSSEIQAEVRNVTGITAAGAAAMAQDLAEARGETAAAEQQIAAVEQKYEEEKSKLPDWGIVLIISLCVLLALIFLFVGYIYSLEKAGTPLFAQLPATSTTKPASGAVEMKNVDVHT